MGLRILTEIIFSMNFKPAMHLRVEKENYKCSWKIKFPPEEISLNLEEIENQIRQAIQTFDQDFSKRLDNTFRDFEIHFCEIWNRKYPELEATPFDFKIVNLNA